MRLIWVTDPHLNFIPYPTGFGDSLKEEGDALVITGDISEAPTLLPHLTQLSEGFGKPIYFVLGNHDYYRSSFAKVHAAVSKHSIPNAIWLRDNVVLLSETTALTGHEGWMDGVYGDAQGSRVIIGDFTLIADLSKHFGRHTWSFMRDGMLNFLHRTSRKWAHEARRSLEAALAQRDHVIFATHFPPFAEASWHQGGYSNSDWMPWFSSGAMGVMLLDVAAKHPGKSITVLCGHTHSPGVYQARDNLRVLTGGAKYRAPEIVRVFEV